VSRAGKNRLKCILLVRLLNAIHHRAEHWRRSRKKEQKLKFLLVLAAALPFRCCTVHLPIKGKKKFFIANRARLFFGSGCLQVFLWRFKPSFAIQNAAWPGLAFCVHTSSEPASRNNKICMHKNQSAKSRGNQSIRYLFRSDCQERVKDFESWTRDGWPDEAEPQTKRKTFFEIHF
jgi:hypothetical protein